MTDFKGIRGWKVQTLSTDPVASQYAGGAWASGGSLNTARGSTLGTSTGSSNAFVAGGYQGPSGATSNTESYNGTSWTEVANIPAAYNYGNGFGTNTASIFAGTDPASSTTYEWNGSSWATPGNNMNTGRFIGGTAGTSTAGSIFAGGEPVASTKHEQWDGTSWTETTDLNTASKNCFTGTGIQTAAISIGNPADTEIWNGTSWTESTDLNTPRFTGAGGGTTTLALFSGGQSPGYVANTELWNGSTWTELSDLSTARGYVGNSASGYSTGASDGIVYGGLTTVGLSNTEEWSAPSSFQKLNLGQVYFNSDANAFKVTEQPVPGGSWASGGSLNTARYNLGSAGISNTSALAFGGASPSRVANTESYDGTSWTEVNDMGSAKNEIAGFGTQTSAILAGGTTAGPAETGAQSWDGTNWTNISSLNTAANVMGSFGASNSSGLKATGYAPGTGNISATETWNGSAWTEVAEVNTTRYLVASFGVQTSGAIVGGDPGKVANVESWNGTSWTEIADINTGRFFGSAIGSGTLTSALVYGGEEPPSTASAKTEFYNGTSWTELNDLSQASSYLGGRATGATSSIAFGGLTTVALANTEEWSVAETNKTITVS